MGTISNLFVGSGALTAENIANFHREVSNDDSIDTQRSDIGDSSVRYCYPNRQMFEQCYVDSFSINDFK